MRTQDAIEHFGGKKELAKALNVWPQVIYQWGEFPPISRQYEIEVKTCGRLKALSDVNESSDTIRSNPDKA